MMEMTQLLMWLNMGAATLNATLQLLGHVWYTVMIIT